MDPARGQSTSSLLLLNVCNTDTSSNHRLGKLDIRLVRLYTAQLVHVLEYLQTMEIMHRDLKPQNIMLDENYNIKIVSLEAPPRIIS